MGGGFRFFKIAKNTVVFHARLSPSSFPPQSNMWLVFISQLWHRNCAISHSKAWNYMGACFCFQKGGCGNINCVLKAVGLRQDTVLCWENKNLACNLPNLLKSHQRFILSEIEDVFALWENKSYWIYKFTCIIWGFVWVPTWEQAVPLHEVICLSCVLN